MQELMQGKLSQGMQKYSKALMLVLNHVLFNHTYSGISV